MAVQYICPICGGQLRVKNSILISAKSKTTNKRGLIFLDPEIGNYTKTTHPSFELQKGEECMIYCPICHTTLNREENPHLVKVNMIDDNNVEYDVFFSNVVGEECTYKIKDKKVEMLGPDAERYKHYFDIPPEDRKYL